MRVTKQWLNELTYKVIGCAIEVHNILALPYWKASMKNAF